MQRLLFRRTGLLLRIKLHHTDQSSRFKVTRHFRHVPFRGREEIGQICRSTLFERRGERFNTVDLEVRLKEFGEEGKGDAFFDEMILLERLEYGGRGESVSDEEGGGDGELFLIERSEFIGVLEDSSKGVLLEGFLQILVSIVVRAY